MMYSGSKSFAHQGAASAVNGTGVGAGPNHRRWNFSAIPASASARPFNNNFSLSSSSSRRRSSLFMTSKHMWMGGFLLFCLVLVYLAVVIAVTQLHDVPSAWSSSTLSSSSLGNALSSSKTSRMFGDSSLSSSSTSLDNNNKMKTLSQLQQESQQIQKQQVAKLEAAVMASRAEAAQHKPPLKEPLKEPTATGAEMESVTRKEQQDGEARLGPLLEKTENDRNQRAKTKVDGNNKDKETNKSNDNNEGGNNDNKDKDKDKEEKNQKKTREGPFRMYDLSAGMDKGIQPQVILPHLATATAEERHAAAIAVAALENYDPPLHQHPTPDFVLTAYLEPVHYDDWEIQPLPLRGPGKDASLSSSSSSSSFSLPLVQYTRVNSCRRLTQQWPVDDTPTDQDPFLPWIHDVFPTADGKFIQFVAQNKRRCKTGISKQNETDIMMQMQPQVALFQHVSVKRINSTSTDSGKDASATMPTSTTSRYRLASHDEADPDGIATRFICRFKPSMEETLSVFNFDYDWTAYRKRYKNTFSKNDGGIKSIHTSQLLFKCPVPDHLQETIRTGASVHNDWATLFVDLIPIRTPPRYGPPVQYFQPRYKEFQSTEAEVVFDPLKAWGTNHVLPEIRHAGRWENIPICLPSLLQYENQTVADLPDKPQERQVKHRLVSCIWASAGYNTRGNRFAINDGQRRLLEWLSYNKVIGFDHFYLYDNSGAFFPDDLTNATATVSTTSLKPIADLFPNHVTYIPWPSQICNNRPNNVDSPGERSSQYAAEASCRLRFGPHVQWIGQFDIDEYLVPMGKHETITSLLDELEKEDTRIISFGSWRAWPRRAFIDEIVPINDPGICWHNEPCFDLTIPTNVTMLQAYNCDRQPPGQKSEVMPAEKQIYRTDYVTHHFIHYSAVTVLSEKNRTEYEADGWAWKFRAFPDPRQRFGNEETEALMLHAKAVAVQDTAGYQRMCSIDNLKLHKRRQGLCRLGVPWPAGEWPKDPQQPPMAGTPEGYAYNCYVNPQIETLLVPRLEQELHKHAVPKLLQWPQPEANATALPQ